MKKTKRLLAVLLTLCLLVGAVAIVSSAAATSQLDASQYGEGITHYLSADFENLDISKNFASAGGGKLADKTGVSMTDYASFSLSASTTVGEESNSYMQLQSKPQETPALVECSSYPFAYVYANATGDVISGKYDYVTLDFDIAATGEGTYLDGASFGPYMVKPAYPAYIYSVTDGEKWYFSNKTTYAAGGSLVEITDELGVWNHVTYIFNVKGTADSKLPVLVYVNGALLCEFKVTLDATTEVQRLAAALSVNMANESYCYAVDNVTSNKYAVGYTSTGTGIDDFLAGGAVGSPELLSDVVYQSGYTYTAAKDSQFYVVDGVRYTLATDAISAIKAGSAVEIARNLHIAKSDIDSFTVTAKNGASVTADPETAGLFVTEKISEADGVTVAKIKRVIGDCPDGVSTQASYIYNDGNLKYNTYLQYANNFTASLKDHGGNRFVQITDASTATLTKNALFRVPLVNNLGKTDEQLRVDYDYQVLDFDISTSSNFYDGINLAIYKNVTNDWVWLGYIFSDNNGGYIFTRNASKADPIPISTDECDWLHVTAVVSGADGSIDVYINGEYYHTAAAKVGANDRVERLEVFFRNGTTVHDFTLNIDNVIIRNYKKGYSSGDAILGLDDYKALGDNTLPIYGLGDVVYGPKYGYDSTATVDYAATGESGNYHVPTGAFLNAKDGETITLKKNVTLISRLSESISSLKIEGAEVILKGEAARYYSFADGMLTKNPLYTVNVYDENGEIVNTYKTDVALAPDITLDIKTSVLGDYKQALAWSFKVGDGEAKPISEWEGVEADSVVSLIPNITSVAWFDNDNNIVAIGEKWFIGSVASRAFDELDELYPLENGWYELAYFWNSGAEDPEDLTVRGNDSFRAVIKPVEAFDMTQLKLNYTLGESFSANYYVPVPWDDEITVTSYKCAPNIQPGRAGSVNGYFDAIEMAVSDPSVVKLIPCKTVVSIDGWDYYKCQGNSATAYAWYAANGFEVNFTVEYDEEIYELSSKVAISRLGTKEKEAAGVVSYTSTVLNNTECGSEAKGLVLNWMKYVDASYLSQDKHVHISEITNALANHTECACLKNITSALSATAPESDMSAFSALADGFAATYKMNHERGMLVLYVPKAYADSVGELKVYSAFTGIDNASASIKPLRYDFTVTTVLDESSTEDNEIYVPKVVSVDGVECYMYTLKAKFGIYNMNAVNTITIEADGAVAATGTYSLLNYVQKLNETVGLYTYDEASGKYVVDSSIAEKDYTVDQHSVNMALALVNFAEAAYEYKVN